MSTTKPNYETESNIHVATLSLSLTNSRNSCECGSRVVYVACLNRAGNMVSVKHFFFRCKNIKLAPNLRHYYLKKIKAPLLTKLLRNWSCNDHYSTVYSMTIRMQMASCHYTRQGDGWNSPTTAGGAVDESKRGSDMKIQARFTVRWFS